MTSPAGSMTRPGGDLAAQPPAVAPAAGAATIDLVVFSLGGLRFAVESAQVQGVAEVADPRGPALADLLGLDAIQPRTPPGRERLLRLAAPGGAVREVRVEEPLSLCRLPVARLHPLPWLVAARSVLPCVRALVFSGDARGHDFSILLDVQRLPGAGAGAD